MGQQELILVIVAGGALLYGLLFCIALWWLVLKSVRFLVRNSYAFGHTVTTRLISLGVVLWFDPRAVTGPIDAIAGFFKPFVANVPQLIASFMQMIASQPDALARLQAINALFAKLTTTFLSALSGFVSNLHLAGLLINLAEWAVLGNVLSFLAQQRPDHPLSRAFASLGRVPYRTRYVLALLGIVTFGSIVGISSIVAVPYLRLSAEATESEKANLKAELESASILVEVYEKKYPANLPASASLAALRNSPAEKAAGDASAAPNPLRIVVDTLDSIRGGVVASYVDLQQGGLPRQEAQRAKVIRQFASNAGRGSQERAQFSGKLQRWYQGEVRIIERELTECVQTIRNFDSVLDNLSSTLGGLLSSSNGFINEESFRPITDSLSQFTKCRTSRIEETNPPELVPAENWGPFGATARWLLRTGSQDLTLIAGMLGFGLLGAAISTAVRKGALLESADEILVSDPTGVIIRGFAAAIVVFLAAMGGLAIFSGAGSASTAEPNPYVLFLTCCIAAVYSEDLWLAARQRFQQKAGLTTDNPKDQKTVAPPAYRNWWDHYKWPPHSPT